MSDSLKYLKENPETPLPEEVQQLLQFLEKEELILSQKISGYEAQLESGGGDEKIQLQIAHNKLRLLELNIFRKQLFAHGENKEVRIISSKLNQIYEKMFQKPAGEDFEQMSIGEKATHLWGKLGEKVEQKFNNSKEAEPTKTLKEQYVEADDELDNILDELQRHHLLALAQSGDASAFWESYATSMDQHKELTEKILNFEKKKRDEGIDELLKTLNLYERMGSKEFQAEIRSELEKTARKILEKQQEKFEGLRGVIQQAVEKGGDLAIDHLAVLVGDEDSLARSIFIQAVKMGKDLAKPVQYEPGLVNAILEDTFSRFQALTGAVDGQKIENLRRACIELKANPDTILKPEAREAFMRTFREFMPESTKMIGTLINLQGDLLHQAWILSHGSENSDFQADSTLRAKFLSYQGKDLIRLIQLYSPFGIMLPESVVHDKHADFKPTSAYEQGWFKERPLVSTAVQGAGLSAMLYAGYKGVGMLARQTLVTRLLAKVLDKPVGKLVPLAGQIYLGYQLGNEVTEYLISKEEEKIFQLLNGYDFPEEIPEDKVEEIRKFTLMVELARRRRLFEGLGYPLEKLGIQEDFDPLNLSPLFSKIHDMRSRGALREAVLTANRKLVLLGFAPFELKE